MVKHLYIDMLDFFSDLHLSYIFHAFRLYFLIFLVYIAIRISYVLFTNYPSVLGTSFVINLCRILYELLMFFF